MPSVIDICNAALVEIGDKTIVTLDDATIPANIVKIWYPITRDSVLRAHPWNFAMKRASLAMVAGETPTMDYSAFFQLPSDCLKVIRLGEEQVDIAYKVEGRRLLCSEPTVSILYTFREEDPMQYDPLFVAALIYRIAANIAWPIRQDKELRKSMFEEYLVRIGEAKGIDAQEGTPEVPQCDDLIRVR